MSTMAKHLAPLSATALVLTLLLTGCTGSAPEPAQGGVSTQEIPGAPAQLSTSVPAAFRPAAEAGNGWQSERGSDNFLGTSAGLTGNFLFSIEEDPTGGYTFTGIDADSGSTSIEVVVPALNNPSPQELGVPTGATTYKGKHYAYVVQAGELSPGHSGYQVTFVEAKAGAEGEVVFVPLGEEPEQTINPLTFRDSDSGEVWVATPERAMVFDEGESHKHNNNNAPLREDIIGITDDGKPIRLRSKGEGDAVAGYIKVGETTIAKLTGDQDLEGFLQDGERLYYCLGDVLHFANLETHETKQLGELGISSALLGRVNTSPDGRYMIVAGYIHDHKTGEAHLAVNNVGREHFIPHAIDDDGIAYGVDWEKRPVSFNTSTKVISPVEGAEFWPHSITSNGTAVMLSNESTNSLVQGIRDQ